MMTKEQMRIWTHRHCRFAVIGKTADVIVAKLEQAGIRQISGLQILQLVLAAVAPYIRRLSEEEKTRILSSLLDIASRLQGTISLVDLRLRLPKILNHLDIPLTHMRSPDVSALVDEVVEILRLKGKEVVMPPASRDAQWDALLHLSDPLRFQPRPQLQKV